jgi:hypothetical protein
LEGRPEINAANEVRGQGNKVDVFKLQGMRTKTSLLFALLQDARKAKIAIVALR